MDEIPAYDPEGSGDHLFVHFEKTGLDTPTAVRRLAQALGCDPRQASYAGLKDRHAVTTQWASVLGARPDRALALNLEKIRVLQTLPHRHKLRTGHLQGNRFTLRVRDTPADQAARARQVLGALHQQGLPNYYGVQRFGRGGGNLEAAWRWLVDGQRAPRERFERKLLASVLQSALFNRWLAQRIRDDLFCRALPGDVMRKEDSGGIFVSDGGPEDQTRVQCWEISPTGPLLGPKARPASGEAAAREAEVYADGEIDEAAQARLKPFAPGGRRVLRVRPQDVTVEHVGEALCLTFTLPAGAYATSLLRELLKENFDAG